MLSESVAFIKAKRWCRQWLKIFLVDCLAPLFDGNARLQLLVWIVLAAVVLPPKGAEPWFSHFSSSWEWLQAFQIAFQFFAAFNAIGAIVKANFALKKIGEWHGGQFVYHQPRHLWTGVVTDKDNELTHVFKVDDIELGALISIRIYPENPKTVKAQVVWPRGQNLMDWRGVTPDVRTGIFLPDDRKLGVRTNAVENASPSTVRIFASSWTIKGKHV